MIGTWKLNAAKSKGVKSGTTKIEAVGDGVKFTSDLAVADGTSSHSEFSGKYDGKDNPVTGSSPYGNAVALTRVNATTTRLTFKQDGKASAVITIVLSADGKTRTATLGEWGRPPSICQERCHPTRIWLFLARG